MTDCLFCKIANKTINATIVYEDNEIIAFHDIHPKADIHILIIPKIHIESMLHTDNSHVEIIGKIMLKTNEIAKNMGLEAGYKISIHTGIKGGQEVPHLHIHLLGNK